MPDIKRILCPVDFSEFSTSAYRHALSLARHYRAELFVQHIVERWREHSGDFIASGRLYMGLPEEVKNSHKDSNGEYLNDGL